MTPGPATPYRISRVVARSVVAALALIAMLPACSSSEDSSAGTVASTEPPSPACELLTAAEIAAATGESYDIDAERSNDRLCVMLLKAGPEGLTIEASPVSNQADFDALIAPGAEIKPVARSEDDRPQDASSAPEEPSETASIGDQALSWSEGSGIQVALARAGGSAVKLTHVRDPQAAEPRLGELLLVALERLPDREFSADAPPGRAVCGEVPVEELRTALELPELDATAFGASRACTLTHPSGVNLVIELAEGDSGPGTLDATERTTVIEGEEHLWVPEAVDGLGDGAIWVLDPVTERTGELTAVFGKQLLRVSSTDNHGGPPLRDRAIVLAALVGPEVAR